MGVSNFEVRFRDAELAIIYNFDLRCRVHRSREDSGQYETERTNSAIADSVVDGGTINLEKENKFDGISEENIQNMSVKDYEEYERNRMETNAWFVANKVTKRIDGAPILSDFIKTYTSYQPSDQFLFNSEQLQKLNSATTQRAKESIP